VVFLHLADGRRLVIGLERFIALGEALVEPGRDVVQVVAEEVVRVLVVDDSERVPLLGAVDQQVVAVLPADETAPLSTGLPLKRFL
jgi:hypothetical protein